MIKTLEERPSERKAGYDKLILAEHKAQRIIDALPVIFTNEADDIRIYEVAPTSTSIQRTLRLLNFESFQ